MTINLNNENEFTLENVKKLIASKDDSQNRQLRVSKSGIAYISDEVGSVNVDDVLFRFETLMQGNGYVGIEASNDESYVKEVFYNLKENWPNPKASYIDY